tara:strand:+ start:495 stop:689 length:195 start_codon:yes stop_codon:yes gene_type:complete
MISKKDINLSIERYKKYKRKILDISQQVFALHLGGKRFYESRAELLNEYGLSANKIISKILKIK